MTKAELKQEIRKTEKIIRVYNDELSELKSQYPNGIPDDIHSQQSDLIVNYINKKSELQSELDSIKHEEYMQKQFRLLHQMKREINNWENFTVQKSQGSSMFDGEYEIYQIMLRLSHEYVENFNKRLKQ